jgi:multidrug efflux system outer membrane protein
LGLLPAQSESARAQLQAYKWAQQVTFSTLVENVATSYYQLRTLDAQLEITWKTLDDRKQSLKLTTTLEQGGNGTLSDVRQAEELLFTVQAEIPDLQRQIQQQEMFWFSVKMRLPSCPKRRDSALRAGIFKASWIYQSDGSCLRATLGYSRPDCSSS